MATNIGFEANNQDVEGGPPPHNEPPPAYRPSYGTSEAAPPPYPANPDDAPPSYDSLFGELQAAKQNSSSVAEFFKKFMVIVLSTVGCTIFIGLVLAVPISMIVIGGLYVNDCPRQSYIPIYLIVGGCFGVLKNLMNIGQRVKNRRENQDDENANTNPIDGTLNCFLVAWFIAGCTWTYRVYGDFDAVDETSPKYCHPTVFWFSFWFSTITFVVFFGSFFLFMLLGACNVWIYSIHGDFTTDDPEASDYCNPTLYYFAFWVTTASYIMVAFLCCTLCCVGMCASFCKTTDND